MTKREYLQELLKEIGILSNMPISKEEAIKKNKSKYLHIDYASQYGGYRLIAVSNKNGSHCEIFDLSDMQLRVNYKTFCIMLKCIRSGLKYNINKN